MDLPISLGKQYRHRARALKESEHMVIASFSATITMCSREGKCRTRRPLLLRKISILDWIVISENAKAEFSSHFLSPRDWLIA